MNTLLFVILSSRLQMQASIVLLTAAVIGSCSSTESETRIDCLGRLKRDLFTVRERKEKYINMDIKTDRENDAEMELFWVSCEKWFWKKSLSLCKDIETKLGTGCSLNICFFLKMLWFFWTQPVLLQRWFSTCLVCVQHTLTPKENRERPESGIF